MLTFSADPGQDSASVGNNARLDEDLQQYTGSRAGNLGIDFVGVDFDQRVIFLNWVANGFEPFGDGPFNNGFAELGHEQGVGHGVSGR